MKPALLTMALILIGAALLSPLWVRTSPQSSALRPPRLHRSLVSGRVKGNFPDRPWAGTALFFGSDSITLKEDGAFSFAVYPGVHILKVCCSERFQQIYREIEVEDRDLYFELEALPLRKISGHLLTPQGKNLRYAVNISAWLVGTNTTAKDVVASDGTFALHLTEGTWKLELDNPNPGYKPGSIIFDGVEVRDWTITIPSVYGASLPLQITLKK